MLQKPKKVIERELRKQVQERLIELTEKLEYTFVELSSHMGVNKTILSTFKNEGENYSASQERCEQYLQLLSNLPTT